MKDDRKRQLKQAFKDGAKETSQNAMLLDEQGLNKLLNYLDERLSEVACDDTPRLTRQWAEKRGIDPDELAASLRHFGGYCDCEVIANVEPDEIF